MNNLAYRKDRVKVSERVERTLYGLVVHEQDYTQKKKRHPAHWYRNSVAKALKLSDRDNPSLRSYEEKLKDIREKLRIKNPLDAPWSIGHCLKNDIPGEVIPMLLRIKEKSGDDLTVRRAKWVALLYPVLAPMVREQFPDDLDKQDIRYGLIPREYALREKYCEALGRDLGTSDFDTLFFIYGNISEEAIAAAMGDNIFIDRPTMDAELSTDDMVMLESKLGKLTQHEIDTFHGYSKALARGYVAELIYMHQHPEDMESLIKKVKEAQHERSHSTAE